MAVAHRFHYLPSVWNMDVRKRMPMVHYVWLNIDFENIFGVDSSRPEEVQKLSGRVLDSRLKGPVLSLTAVTALWSLNKTHLS